MELVKSITTPVSLDYDYVTGRAQSRFLRGIAEGRILGQRCTECRRVYVPSRGACPLYPKRVAWRTTSWLESTHVLGAATASSDVSDSVMTWRMRCTSRPAWR